MKPVLKVQLDSVLHNYGVLCQLAPNSKVGAVVKANAYGLGMTAIARALHDGAGCDLFMVALPEEGVQLREALRSNGQIWVLNGPADVQECEACIHHRLVPVLNSPHQIDLFRSCVADAGAVDYPVVLAYDTGMNRLGMGVDDDAMAAILQGLELRALMSHLACAADAQNPMNSRQLEQFLQMTEQHPNTPRSLANSAGMFLGEAWHLDICRPGIALYGGLPGHGLRNVAQVQATVLQVRTVPRGDSVGYNALWRAQKDSSVAIVGLGYADGWGADNVQVLVGDTPLPVIGEVSMDLIAVDVTGIDGAVRPGDTVLLLDEQLPLHRHAECMGKSAYEVLTGLGARYKREYVQ